MLTGIEQPKAGHRRPKAAKGSREPQDVIFCAVSRSPYPIRGISFVAPLRPGETPSWGTHELIQIHEATSYLADRGVRAPSAGARSSSRRTYVPFPTWEVIPDQTSGVWTGLAPTFPRKRRKRRALACGLGRGRGQPTAKKKGLTNPKSPQRASGRLKSSPPQNCPLPSSADRRMHEVSRFGVGRRDRNSLSDDQVPILLIRAEPDPGRS